MNMNRQHKRGRQPRVFARCAASLLAAWVALSCGRTPVPPPDAAQETPTAPSVKRVLTSTIPGRWYAADPATLGDQMRALLDEAKALPLPDLIALILPHAGFQYSGSTAAAGVKTITKPYKRVVVLGPSHTVDMPDRLSVPRGTHAATPLGEIPLDEVFIERLLREPFVREDPQVNMREHSTQMVLPLLQTVLPPFKLVPVVVGACSEAMVVRVGALLKRLVDDETLVVVSSDFTHYGPNYGYIPFRDEVPARLKQLDNGAFEAIRALDVRGFLGYCRETGATICGRTPIAILIAMLDPATRVVQTAYATSGGMTGDYANSVSYLSIAFAGRWRAAAAPSGVATLGANERRQLLTLARKALTFHLQQRRVPEAKELGFIISEAMEQPRGVFVTLRREGRLRGCIGEIFPRQPLVRAVIANAINAGVNDWRFTPVTEDECAALTFEISVLTPPAPVAAPGEIRVGTDGVVLNKAGRSAVFLPQVATEQRWNREQMLTELARKAGLPPDAWKEGASFLVFQAEVFDEGGK
jgi:MEMO1 family protein